MIKRTLKIGRDSNNLLVELKLELRTKETKGKKNINLKTMRRDYTELSICGNAWNKRKTDCDYCGQINETIREDLDSYQKLYIDKNKVIEILDIWDRWHLNDLNAGCKEQNDFLRTVKYTNYTDICELLKGNNLYEVRGYKYGHGWLFEKLPLNVEKRILELFDTNIEK